MANSLSSFMGAKSSICFSRFQAQNFPRRNLSACSRSFSRGSIQFPPARKSAQDKFTSRYRQCVTNRSDAGGREFARRFSLIGPTEAHLSPYLCKRTKVSARRRTANGQ